jgi:hypothetical protein
LAVQADPPFVGSIYAAISVKQLLIVVVYVSVALVTLANAGKGYAHEIAQLLTLSTLIAIAYGIWTSVGEARAFRAGFVGWGSVYFLLFVVIQTRWIDIGAGELLRALRNPIMSDPNGAMEFRMIGDEFLSLLFGLIGGWVTVYFYRKRQRMLSVSKQ